MGGTRTSWLHSHYGHHEISLLCPICERARARGTWLCVSVDMLWTDNRTDILLRSCGIMKHADSDAHILAAIKRLQVSADNRAFIAVGLVLSSASSSNLNHIRPSSPHTSLLRQHLKVDSTAYEAQKQASWECVMHHSVPAWTQKEEGSRCYRSDDVQRVSSLRVSSFVKDDPDS